MKIAPLSLQWRISLGFSALILLFLGAMVCVELTGIPGTAVEGRFARQRSTVLKDMELISDLFSQRFISWFAECRRTVEGVSRSPLVRRALDSAPSESNPELTRELDMFLACYPDFDSIVILNPVDGSVRGASGTFIHARSASELGIPPGQLALLVTPGYTEVNDIHLLNTRGDHLCIIRQVISLADPDKVSALIVVEADLDNALQALIGSRAALRSRHWDFVLAANINSSTTRLHQYDSDLNSVQSTVPRSAVFSGLLLAIAGTEGPYDGPDELGHPVLAFHRQAKFGGGIALGLALKMNRDLALKPALVGLFRQIVFWFALLVVGIGACLLLARAIARPIQELVAVAQRVSVGDFTARASARHQAELGLLATVFNGMIGRLQHWYQDLEKEVTERTRALKASEEEVRRLNAGLEKRVAERTAELEGVNRELEAFSYSVSHDLRAPLRAIDGFSQIVLDDCAGEMDDKRKEYLGRIRQNAGQMARLIDDLLRLSRLTRMELHHEEVNLSDLVSGVARELQEHEPDRVIEWRIAPGLKARGDRALLLIALQNLLGNAVKYTSRRERAIIEVSQMPSDGEAVFVVRDNGAGFDMAYASRLFTPFQRLHSTGEFLGTGIGLAIVDRIIRRHGGRIWAEAVVEQGAAFYFSLPEGGKNGSEGS